jgi:hypothetical protein
MVADHVNVEPEYGLPVLAQFESPLKNHAWPEFDPPSEVQPNGG